MSVIFKISCPECGEEYVLDFPDGETSLNHRVKCDECDYEMNIDAEIDVIVNVS